MRSIKFKVFIGLILIIIVVVLIDILKINNKNNIEIIETTKYSLDEKTKNYEMKTIEEYKRYLKEIATLIKPKELQTCIDYSKVYNRSIYGMREDEDGNWVLQQIYKYAYEELLCRVIRRGEDWSELPLTEHFREKFNESDGVLNDQYYYYDKGIYLNPGFNYNERTVVTTCKDKEGNEYYGWYDFTLDRDGYLDDVIFNHREEIPWEPPYEDNPYE